MRDFKSTSENVQEILSIAVFSYFETLTRLLTVLLPTLCIKKKLGSFVHNFDVE